MAERPKTTVSWRQDHFSPIAEDLNRYQARQRGKRLKELSLLGLLAERMGFAIDYEASGGARLTGETTALISLAPVQVEAKLDSNEEGVLDDPRADDFLAQFING